MGVVLPHFFVFCGSAPCCLLSHQFDAHILQIAVLSSLVPPHSLLSQDVLLATGLSFRGSFAALLRIHSSWLVFQVTTCPEIKATFQHLKRSFWWLNPKMALLCFTTVLLLTAGPICCTLVLLNLCWHYRFPGFSLPWCDYFPSGFFSCGKYSHKFKTSAELPSCIRHFTNKSLFPVAEKGLKRPFKSHMQW